MAKPRTSSPLETVKLASSQEELERTFQLRREVFVVEQKVAPDEEFDEFEGVCRHFYIENEGKAVACGRWRETEKGLKVERMAVAKSARRQGLASQVLSAIVEDIQKQTDWEIYLHAQLEAIPLYNKHGFQPVEGIFYECEIAHQKMVLPGNGLA